jgi:hypothetical protein
MAGRVVGVNPKEFLGLCIVLLGCYLHFFYSMYPRRLDMDYEALLNFFIGETSGFFDASEISIAGSRIFSLIASQITNIPHQELSMLPLIFLPLALLLATVLRTIFHGDNVYLLIFIAYVLPIGYPPIFTGGSHELGFLLLLSMILILLTYSDDRNLSATSVITILLCIVLIINYISYQTTFVMIIFLLFLFGLTYLYSKYFYKTSENLEEPDKVGYKPYFPKLGIVLIPFIIAFSINQFFYKSFMPFLEDSVYFSSGLERFFQAIGVGGPASVDNPFLVPYYDAASSELFFLSIFRFILIIAGLLICWLILAHKFLKKEKLLFSEMVFLALTVSAVAVFFIYNILGHIETTYLIFCGLMGYGLLYVNLRRFKTYIIAVIVVLSIISIGYTITMIDEDAYVGHRDYNDDSYMYLPYLWVSSHLDLRNIDLVSDRFTGDYFIFQRFRERNTKDLSLPSFREDDLLLLLEPGQIIEKNRKNKYYIINNKLEYFVIDRWMQFKSWKLFKDKIRLNPYIHKIYSTENIDIANTVSTNNL